MKKLIFCLLLIVFTPCLLVLSACNANKGDTKPAPEITQPVQPGEETGDGAGSGEGTGGETGGDNQDPTPEVKYDVTISNTILHGYVNVSKNKAKEGDVVTIEVAPATGYRLVLGSLKYNQTPVEDFSFTMPNTNVVLTASFEKTLPSSMIGHSFVKNDEVYLKVSNEYNVFTINTMENDCIVTEYPYSYVSDTEITIDYKGENKNITFTKSGQFYNASFNGEEYTSNRTFGLVGEYSVFENEAMAEIYDIKDGETTITQTNIQGEVFVKKVKCYNVANYIYIEETAGNKTTKTFGEIANYDWETVLAVRADTLYKGMLTVITEGEVSSKAFYLTKKMGDYSFTNSTFRCGWAIPPQPGMPKSHSITDLILIKDGKLETRMFNALHTQFQTEEAVDYTVVDNSLFATIKGKPFVATIVTTNSTTNMVILNGENLEVCTLEPENQRPNGKWEMYNNKLTNKLIWEFKDGKVIEYTYNKEDDSLIATTELGKFEYFGSTLIVYASDRTYSGMCVITNNIPSYRGGDTTGALISYVMTKVEE